MSAPPSLARLLLVGAAVAACGPPPAAAVGGPGAPDAGSPPGARVNAAPRCLSIAAWNDMHGQLEPDNVQVDATVVPAGGVIAIADQVAALRATDDAVVVLDAGDLFTGPLDSTLAEGAPVIDAYNVMGVDAAAIGNHEFDFGPVGYARAMAAPNVGDEAGADGPRGALLARMEAARFPFLTANVHREGGHALGWPRARASTRIARGGFDVGVVGYSTNTTPITTLRSNVVGLDFATGAASAVATEVRALRAAGAMPVVLLAHASLDGELPQRLEDPADPAGARRVGELAELLDAIPVADRPDVIVAGHRHQWMLGRVRGVPIVSSDQHGVGLARIRFCRAGGAVPGAGGLVLERIERRVAMASSPPLSPLGVAVAAAVAPWQAKVKAEADVLVATLPRTCLAKSLSGTALVEQTARGVAEQVGRVAPPPHGEPVVAFINSGSVRIPLRAGPLLYRDLFAAQPFENAIAVCATTRAGLARLLANAVRGTEAHERLPFGIAGAKVTLERAANGAVRVKHFAIDAGGRSARAAARDDDPIWLATSDYILSGGDGFLEGVKCTAGTISQVRVRDAWRAVIAREQACDGPPRNITFGE
jgi:5'-nucleotidase